MSDSAASGSLDLRVVVPGVRATKADPAPIDSEAFRQGDRECFETVLDRFGPLIRSVVNAYAGDRDDQDDLYQEVCVRLLTRREHYREMGAMAGWVTTLARGVCRNWRNARESRESAVERYSALDPPVEESDDMLDDPSRLLECHTFLEGLERCVATLPRRQATAWRLVHIEGHSTNRAARMMETTPATVRSHIRHARDQLRKIMKDEKNELMS